VGKPLATAHGAIAIIGSRTLPISVHVVGVPRMNTKHPSPPRMHLAHQSALCALTLHLAGITLLFSAAGLLRMIHWQPVVWLISGSLTLQAGLLALVRRQALKVDHDPALLGPFTLFAIADVAAVAILAEAGQRTLLAAALTPLMALSAMRLRRGGMRTALIAGYVMACHTLLSVGHDQHMDDGLAVALSLFMLTPLLALVLHQQARVVSWQALSVWLLTDEPRQRMLLTRYLVASVNAAAGLTALEYGASQGMVEPVPTRIMSIAGAIVIVGAYGYSRAGLNKSWRDPSLTEPKLLAVVTFLALGYYLGNIGRDIALILLVTLEMFGMFVITPTQVLRISVYATIAFGVSMFMVAYNDTMGLQGRLQALHFVLMLVILATISWLARQLGVLRNTLKARNDDLSEALNRIQILATHDDLTGLVNRRHMVDLMETQLKRRARTGNEVCIALLDLDHFKQINDTHGHGVGDEVLRTFAMALKTSMRNSDIAARWGGEEFMVLFDDANIETARLSLERARIEVARLPISDSVPALRITFSCGLTESLPGETLEHTVDRADQALYAAKAAGRNRVMTRSQRVSLICQNEGPETSAPPASNRDERSERSGAA
jgi:diguanylate cyclase (GGDEF)-like protein